MATMVDGKKLKRLTDDIVDSLRVLRDKQVNSLERLRKVKPDKWAQARMGLASAYISAAEAQCAAVWGNDDKALKHTQDVNQKLSDMMAKLEKPD